MEALIKTAQLLVSLSILVIIHELGHFLFAKLFKTRVEKFYLFFNPWFSLFKFKKGDTEYGVGWLPLGGYVKISGMIDESMDKEQMKLPPQPFEFRSKKAYERLLIMIGGVLFNFILALLIYSAILYTWGETYLPNKSVTHGIMVDSLGYEAGFRNGDKIVSVGGESVEDFFDIQIQIILENAYDVKVERDGKIVDVNIPTEMINDILNSKGMFMARIPFVVGDFPKNSNAKLAGMLKEDQLIAMNGQPMMYFDQYIDSAKKYAGQPVDLTVLRGTDTLLFNVEITNDAKYGIFTITNYAEFFELESFEYTLMASIPAGINRGVKTFKDYLKQLKLLFNKEAKAYESLGGFITIGKIFPGVWDWQSFWNLTAFLSIILAIVNVLPIPALDGGHVMFLFYELVTGRKPSDKFLEYAQIVGMILLLALLIYANGNDIVKLFK